MQAGDALDPHQVTGAAFLASRVFALLWDEQGVGKTLTAIRACDHVGAARILVAAPRAVKQHWARSFLRWQTQTRDVTVHEGSPTEKLLARTGAHIVTHASFASAQGAARIMATPWDIFIADEATEYRDFSAQRTRAVLGGEGLWRHAWHTWFLTGTPIVNSAADLYPLAAGAWSAAMDQPAPSWWDFCRRYTILRPNTMGEYVPRGVLNAAELADHLRPFVYRRTARSVGMTLPALTIQNCPIALPAGAVESLAAQLTAAGWTPARLGAKLEWVGEIKDPSLARIRHALGIAKAPAAAAMIVAEWRAGGGPLLVFFQHRNVCELLCAELRRHDMRVGVIDGTVSRGELDDAERDYQAGHLDCLLVQTAAGGMGLTLTRGTKVMVVEMPWTATALHQAIKRAHRRGQDRAVSALILQAKGFWLDEAMTRIIQQKEAAADDLLNRLTRGD